MIPASATMPVTPMPEPRLLPPAPVPQAPNLLPIPAVRGLSVQPDESFAQPSLPPQPRLTPAPDWNAVVTPVAHFEPIAPREVPVFEPVKPAEPMPAPAEPEPAPDMPEWKAR